MPAEKRRSERLMLTIPLVVSGTDLQGNPFKENARTLTLNRHGALIQMARPLQPGQKIRVANALAHLEADFSVVGPVAPHSESGGLWGVESLNGQGNIWGIQFPPASGNPPEPSALLECRKCHTAELKRVSLIEAEVLETSGILIRLCAKCDENTAWGVAEKVLAIWAGPGVSSMFTETPGKRPPDKRRHPRASLQLPVLVRDYYGGVEISKSENVSKGGFCFVSERNYHIGSGIVVALPYNSAEQTIEVPARVVRCQQIAQTPAKIYGVRYEQARS